MWSPQPMTRADRDLYGIFFVKIVAKFLSVIMFRIYMLFHYKNLHVFDVLQCKTCNT